MSSLAHGTGAAVKHAARGGRCRGVDHGRRRCGVALAGLLTAQAAAPAFTAAAVAAAAVAKPAAPPVVLTILNGGAVLHIGANTVAAALGLRLPQGSLVETLAATTLLRLEWADGSALDLGPDSAVMIEPGALGRSGATPEPAVQARGAVAPAFYLLRGWAKHRSAPSAEHRGHVSPQLDALPAKGAVVMHVVAGATWLFVESGSARLVERAGAKARLDLSIGQSYLRQGAAKGELAQRPNAEQLKDVPRGFRDTLPLRAAQFQGQEIEAKALQAPYYAELRPWLIVAEPALRREFPRRFAPLLREPGFRAALAAKLPDHPEWGPLVYPERYLKRASAPTGERR